MSANFLSKVSDRMTFSFNPAALRSKDDLGVLYVGAARRQAGLAATTTRA